MYENINKQQEQKTDELQTKKRRHPYTMLNSAEETMRRMSTVSERIEQFTETLYANTKE